MKVYIVFKECTGEYSFSTIFKVFSTLEKAKNYKSELEDKYKEDLMFGIGFYFEIEELEVE